MLTLTVTSLAREVLCDDICATNQNVVQMTHRLLTHYKICSQNQPRKYRKWC